jgi:hypothetical protein
LIRTLLVTIIVESVVVIGYSLWRRKPVRSILFTSLWTNLFTQSFLWIGLNFFFQHYLIALTVAELLIWGMESVLLYSVRANHLHFKEAAILSLLMNVLSFTLGWFVPI